MTAKALMIKRSEIAMAIISARSSRRSCLSEGPDELSAGGNLFVLKLMHSCEKNFTRSSRKERRSSPKKDRPLLDPVEFGRTSDAPRASSPRWRCTISVQGCADDTIVMAALYACIVAAALHMGGDRTDEVLWYEYHKCR
jgi:hypothetical protein